MVGPSVPGSCSKPRIRFPRITRNPRSLTRYLSHHTVAIKIASFPTHRPFVLCSTLSYFLAGQILVLPGNTAEKLGLLDFRRPSAHRSGGPLTPPSSAFSSVFDGGGAICERLSASQPVLASSSDIPTSATPGRKVLRVPEPSPPRTSFSHFSGHPPTPLSSSRLRGASAPPSPAPVLPHHHEADAHASVRAAPRLPSPVTDVLARSTAAAAPEGAAEVRGARGISDAGSGSGVLLQGRESLLGQDAAWKSTTPSEEFNRTWDEGWKRGRAKGSRRPRSLPPRRVEGDRADEEPRCKKNAAEGNSGKAVGPVVGTNGEHVLLLSGSSQGEGCSDPVSTDVSEPVTAEKLMTPTDLFDSTWSKSWQREQRRNNRLGSVRLGKGEKPRSHCTPVSKEGDQQRQEQQELVWMSRGGSQRGDIDGSPPTVLKPRAAGREQQRRAAGEGPADGLSPPLVEDIYGDVEDGGGGQDHVSRNPRDEALKVRFSCFLSERSSSFPPQVSTQLYLLGVVFTGSTCDISDRCVGPWTEGGKHGQSNALFSIERFVEGTITLWSPHVGSGSPQDRVKSRHESVAYFRSFEKVNPSQLLVTIWQAEITTSRRRKVQ